MGRWRLANPICQIARLYRPLNTSLSDLDDFDDETGTQLLPTHADRTPPSKGNQYKPSRLTDVWDEREEVFDIGGVSDDEDDRIPGPAGSNDDTPRYHANGGPIPKISVNGS